MKRGPQSGGARKDFVAALRVRLPDPDDWLIALAEEASRIGLEALARKTGAASSTLSSVLSGTYKAGTERIEQAVRGALMGLTVRCPALSADIGREACLKHQRQPLSTASPSSVRLFYACRNGCPNANASSGA